MYLFVTIQVAAVRCRIVALIAGPLFEPGMDGVMTTKQGPATKDTVTNLCTDQDNILETTIDILACISYRANSRCTRSRGGGRQQCEDVERLC